ncbi:MAG: endo-1,4-beta-xylanase [Treponema sp.]|jgi:hypothetical protein|nr:endo-1,4-beta-xylanase [Treponema sp.]
MPRLLPPLTLPVLALLLFSCASAPQPQVQQDVPADFAGLVHAGGSRTRKEYAYLDYLGTSWIVNTFYWDSIEVDDGEWDFLSYDAFVDKAKAEGKKILGVLAYDSWLIHDDKNTKRYIPPEKLPRFLNYVRETVGRYRGRVDAWCVWNEPNFIFWRGSRGEFFELARQTADAVREADDGAILLGGAFNRNVFGLDEGFIRGLFESGAMDKADAVAFHPYELNPVRSARLYDQFRDIAADYGFAGRIWITEMGYPTGGWYPTSVSEKKLPAYVIKTFTLLAAKGAQRLFWYQLFDPHKRKAGNSEDFFGLVRSRRDYRSKGAEAFRLCARFLSGTTYYPQKPKREGLPASLQSFYFEGNGRAALVLWKEYGAVPVRLTLSGSARFRHDPVSGDTVGIPAETLITVGAMPVFVTWEGGEARISAP